MSADVLDCSRDPFNSVHVKPRHLPENLGTFKEKLQKSLAVWKEDKCKGVWIYLPIEKNDFISAAINLGFEFHHTKPKELVMSKWLIEGEKSRLPHFTTHFAGVGGVCLATFEENGQSKLKLLVIKERSGPGRGKTNKQLG